MITEKVPKRLVIGNSKGGVAKSTTVRNLAVIAAADGLTVATVDLDKQRSLTQWVERRPAGAYPISHFEATLMDVESLKELTGFDIVIVDTPPLVTDSDPDQVRNDESLRNLYDLLKFADFVLTPTLQQIEDVSETVAWMKLLGKLNIKCASLLSATTRRTLSFDDAKRKLSVVGLHCGVDIQRLEDIPASSRQGIGIIELKKGKGQEDFIAVWQFVKQQLGMSGAE